MFCTECATCEEKMKFGIPPELPEVFFIIDLNLSDEENILLLEKCIHIKKPILKNRGLLNEVDGKYV